jgi:iron(III) transport system substrate-binding protein
MISTAMGKEERLAKQSRVPKCGITYHQTIVRQAGEGKMKAFVKLLTLCLLVSFMASCSAPATPMPAATQPPKPVDTVAPAQAPEPTLSEAEAWLKAAELGKYAPAKQDWAAIEAAAKKEGKVVVYANSSRIEKEITLFEAKYPDIKLEGYDVDDIVTKVVEEEKAGNVVGDVWFNSDGAQLFGEVYPKGYVVPFVPDTLLDVIPPEGRTPFVVSRFGVRALGYNTELNPKGCPITNWWQLTEPAWKGKVFIEDPLSDVSTMSILTAITQHGDELAAAYKELYGKDIVLDEDTPNAAWLWLKKFAQNKPVPEPGGDETVQAFASPGMKEAGVGFTSYSKYRDTQEGALVFDVCKDVKPVMGVQTATYLAILNRASHPNAAKLFINFVLNEGHKPWNVIGDYSARTDVLVPEGAIPKDELNVWTMDDAFIYKNISQVRDFYTLNLLQ